MHITDKMVERGAQALQPLVLGTINSSAERKTIAAKVLSAALEGKRVVDSAALGSAFSLISGIAKCPACLDKSDAANHAVSLLKDLVIGLLDPESKQDGDQDE